MEFKKENIKMQNIENEVNNIFSILTKKNNLTLEDLDKLFSKNVELKNKYLIQMKSRAEDLYFNFSESENKVRNNSILAFLLVLVNLGMVIFNPGAFLLSAITLYLLLKKISRSNKKINSKKETKENITKPEEISYTNKFECSRIEKIKKFDLDNKNAGRLTQEQMKERQNSPVAINEKISKIYDFTKDGSKLLGFYEIHTYEYVVDDYNMDKEKSSYSCGEYENYGFKICEITTTKNSIIMTKVADINSDYNKDMVSKMTLESIKTDYAEGDMYTCN